MSLQGFFYVYYWGECSETLAVDGQLYYIMVSRAYPSRGGVTAATMKRAWLSAACMHDIHSALQPTGSYS